MPSSTHDQPPAQTNEKVWQDNGFDLSRYLLILLTWWREIIFVSVLAAAGGLVMNGVYQTLWPRYTASAMVTIIPTRTDISITKEISNVDRQQTQATLSARQSALLGLVYNGEVARTVFRRVGGQLSEEERSMSWLLRDSITGELVESQNRDKVSDLIRIQATARSPETAQVIANAWAKEYVNHVSFLWQTDPELRKSIMTELANTQDRYQVAQQKLEQYISTNQTERLDREIQEKRKAIEKLSASREVFIEARTIALSRVYEADKKVESAKVDSFNQKVESALSSLAGSYEVRQKLIRLLDDAQGLRDLIERGGEAGTQSNGLAILLLKAQTFASSTDWPESLELRIDNQNAMHESLAQQRADVDALIKTLQDRIERLRETIASQSESLSNGASHVAVDTGQADGSGRRVAIQEQYSTLFVPDGPNDPGKDVAGNSADLDEETAAIQVLRDRLINGDDQTKQIIFDLEDSIQTLQEAKQIAFANLRELTKKRDLLMKSVNILQSKVMEIDLESAATNAKIRLASPAVTSYSDGLSLFQSTVLAGIAGLITIMFFITFLAEPMGARPFFARHKAADG